MRRSLAFFTVLLGAGFTSLVFAGQSVQIIKPTINEIPPTESVSAAVELPHPAVAAWGVFDVETGELLASEQTTKVLPIASVTKLFVGAAASQTTSADTEFLVTWSDINTEGEAGELYYAMRTTPRALLVPLLLESSNDAGEAIRRVLGSDFERLLAEYTTTNGLFNTVIVDGSGLSAQNVSSVRDLARFYSFLRAQYPQLLAITKLRAFVGEEDSFVNNNPLHNHPAFVAGKHGYTREAGKTFVGSFTLETTGREIGLVILGSGDIRSDADVLLEYANAAF